MNRIFKKPYTEDNAALYSDFAEYANQNQLHIIEDDFAYYAIKPDGSEIIQDGKIIPNVNWEDEQAQAECERIKRLSLTAADVERGIYRATGKDFDDVLAEVQKAVEKGAPIDLKELKIEFKANNFYRGNPYIDVIGQFLGFTPEQLDRFFDTNDYKELLPAELEE